MYSADEQNWHNCLTAKEVKIYKDEMNVVRKICTAWLNEENIKENRPEEENKKIIIEN